jgi:predicted membrane channel-forming protein YqfA (hemolysin III family)
MLRLVTSNGAMISEWWIEKDVIRIGVCLVWMSYFSVCLEWPRKTTNTKSGWSPSRNFNLEPLECKTDSMCGLSSCLVVWDWMCGLSSCLVRLRLDVWVVIVFVSSEIGCVGCRRVWFFWDWMCGLSSCLFRLRLDVWVVIVFGSSEIGCVGCHRVWFAWEWMCGLSSCLVRRRMDVWVVIVFGSSENGCVGCHRVWLSDIQQRQIIKL